MTVSSRFGVSARYKCAAPRVARRLQCGAGMLRAVLLVAFVTGCIVDESSPQQDPDPGPDWSVHFFGSTDVEVGQTIVAYAEGAIDEITEPPLPVDASWSSSPSGILSILQPHGGDVTMTAIGPGTTTLTVSAEGDTKTFQIIVTRRQVPMPRP